MDLAAVFDEALLSADLRLAGADLQGDEGLASAVVLSLFTDRRAEPDDALPGAADDRRGWWGDAAPANVAGLLPGGDKIGSRLWLLGREKQLPSVLRRAEAYAAEALAWLVEDGLARRVTVTATVPRAGVLGLEVQVDRPAGDVDRYRFESFWGGN